MFVLKKFIVQNNIQNLFPLHFILERVMYVYESIVRCIPFSREFCKRFLVTNLITHSDVNLNISLLRAVHISMEHRVYNLMRFNTTKSVIFSNRIVVTLIHFP